MGACGDLTGRGVTPRRRAWASLGMPYKAEVHVTVSKASCLWGCVRGHVANSDKGVIISTVVATS